MCPLSDFNVEALQLPIIDFGVSITGGWEPWLSKVPQMEIEAHRVTAADIVVPTLDTVRHELLLNTWLSERKPLVLCGPPGSGKTMTLLSALRYVMFIYFAYLSLKYTFAKDLCVTFIIAFVFFTT